MLHSDIEIVYHLQEEIDDAPHENELIQSFKWLDKMILFMPMWSAKEPNNVTRFGSRLMAIIITCYMMFDYIYFMRNNVISGEDIIPIVIIGIQLTMTGIARFLGLYYYYFNFNFSWYNQPLSNEFINYSKNIIRRYNVILIILTTGYIASDLIYLVIRCVAYSSDYGGWSTELTGYLVFVVLHRLMKMYPLLFSECVAAVIFLKFAMCLNSLSESTRSQSRSTKEIFKDYCILYEHFRTEYCFSIKWQIHFLLLGTLMTVWFETYSLLFPSNALTLFGNILLFVGNVCIFLLFLIPASLVSESFHDLEESLWIHSRNCMIEQEDQNMALFYHYFTQYALRHPIQIKVGNLTVSKKSIVRFIINLLRRNIRAPTIKQQPQIPDAPLINK